MICFLCFEREGWRLKGLPVMYAVFPSNFIQTCTKKFPRDMCGMVMSDSFINFLRWGWITCKIFISLKERYFSHTLCIPKCFVVCLALISFYNWNISFFHYLLFTSFFLVEYCLDAVQLLVGLFGQAHHQTLVGGILYR